MPCDLYLRNGRVVTEDGVYVGGITVSDGVIGQLVHGDPDLDAADTVDLDGRILFPGVVDAHVHFSEINREFEGYEHGSRAAAAGGTTTVLDMPLNDLPPTIDREKLAHKRRVVADRSVVDYAHWGGFVDDNVARLRELHDDGVIGYKAFMKCCTDYPYVDDGLLHDGLREVAVTGNVIAVHAENEHVVSRRKRALLARGRRDREALLEAHTKEQELEAIQRAIYWAGVTGGRLHIVHVSIADGIRAATRARLAGTAVTTETCAHYLFFDAEDHHTHGPVARCFPPIRERPDVEELWRCVLRGEVDMITSDHSPFHPDDLTAGEHDVWHGAGIRGVQSTLPAMVTAGVHQRGLSWPALARLLAGNPARTFGLHPRKGVIAPGADADVVIIDPDAEWTLRPEHLFSRYPYSPYVGRTFRGRIERTLVRGRTVFDGTGITVSPGFGELLRRRG